MLLALTSCCLSVGAFTVHQVGQSAAATTGSTSSSLFSSSSRRNFIDQTAAVAATTVSTILAAPQIANAGIDPNALKNLQVEGDTSGIKTRMTQIENLNNNYDPNDLVDIPFTKLSSGVSYREYREGKTTEGAPVVQPGSKVAVELTIRCKSFATANDPGGVKYFSTKKDTDFNELAWTMGDGTNSAGLEEGMIGMHKGGLRRIEVPSTMVFEARNNGQLPLPSEGNKDGKRLFEQRLFKTDATLLFEVLVTRIK